MKIGAFHSTCRKAIEVRGLNGFAPVTGEISVAHVISHDEDDIGLRIRSNQGKGKKTD